MDERRSCATALILGLALLACAWSVSARASQCVDCHTTPAKLIPAVRELGAAAARLPGGSELAAGEG